MASDQQAFLETAVSAAAGDGDRVEGLDEVAEALEEPLSAAVYAGEYACGALAMGQADADDQAQAAELVAAAGTVDPYLAFAMGVRPEGDVRVAMEFADDDQARVERRQPHPPRDRAGRRPGRRLRRPVRPRLRPS